ncbi:hypothetical protein AAVH_11234 [Aphelenchoides avenae]|nr:hypothetical protein AAVH_11234 [Aphelenchus avenae]
MDGSDAAVTWTTSTDASGCSTLNISCVGMLSMVDQYGNSVYGMIASDFPLTCQGDGVTWVREVDSQTQRFACTDDNDRQPDVDHNDHDDFHDSFDDDGDDHDAYFIYSYDHYSNNNPRYNNAYDKCINNDIDYYYAEHNGSYNDSDHHRDNTFDNCGNNGNSKYNGSNDVVIYDNWDGFNVHTHCFDHNSIDDNGHNYNAHNDGNYNYAEHDCYKHYAHNDDDANDDNANDDNANDACDFNSDHNHTYDNCCYNDTDYDSCDFNSDHNHTYDNCCYNDTDYDVNGDNNHSHDNIQDYCCVYCYVCYDYVSDNCAYDLNFDYCNLNDDAHFNCHDSNEYARNGFNHDHYSYNNSYCSEFDGFHNDIVDYDDHNSGHYNYNRCRSPNWCCHGGHDVSGLPGHDNHILGLCGYR